MGREFIEKMIEHSKLEEINDVHQIGYIDENGEESYSVVISVIYNEDNETFDLTFMGETKTVKVKRNDVFSYEKYEPVMHN